MSQISYEMVNLKGIKPNPKQPRQEFNKEELSDLAESIKKNGLIHPISLLELENEKGYTIIGGERRFKAHQMLGKKTIEALVYRNVANPNETLINISLDENNFRIDLTESEIRKKIVDLHDNEGYSFVEIGRKFRKTSGWASIRYYITQDEEFEKLLNEDVVTTAWFEAVTPFKASYSDLKEVLFTAIRNKKYKNHRELRNFILDCKREKLPSEIVKSYILYPKLFTKKVRAKVTELSKEEALSIVTNFSKIYADDEMSNITEEIILEYIEEQQRRKEEKVRMAELRERLAEQEEEESKKLEEIENEYHSKISDIHKKAEAEFKKRKNLIEKEMANIYTDGEIKLTPQQEEELKKLETEYQQKKKEQEESKIKKQKEVEQKHVKKLQETKKLLADIQEKWEQESYVNPIRDEIRHVAHQLLMLSGIPQNWEKFNLTHVIEEMPQIEFEGICRDVDSILQKLSDNQELYKNLKMHLDRRANNPIRAIVSREKQKQKLKVVESKN